MSVSWWEDLGDAAREGRKFRSSDVTIRHPYFVDCDLCGERVDDEGQDGLATRAEAEDVRRAHIESHRNDR